MTHILNFPYDFRKLYLIDSRYISLAYRVDYFTILWPQSPAYEAGGNELDIFDTVKSHQVKVMAGLYKRVRGNLPVFSIYKPGNTY